MVHCHKILRSTFYWYESHHLSCQIWFTIRIESIIFLDIRVELVMPVNFLGTHDFHFIHFANNSILIHILAENCNAYPHKIVWLLSFG